MSEEVNLKKLRQLCETNKNYDDIKLIIESLCDRQKYARYHYKEFNKLSSYDDTMGAVEQLSSEKTQIQLKANTLACVHNIHTVHDTLSYLIFKILKLDLKEEKVSLYNVVKELDKLQKDEYNTLLELFKELKKDNYFQYLCDIDNHSKHRSIIYPSSRIDFLSKKPIKTTYFRKFSYNDREYEEKNVEEFLTYEYKRESKLVIQIMNELIKILEKI